MPTNKNSLKTFFKTIDLLGKYKVTFFIYCLFLGVTFNMGNILFSFAIQNFTDSIVNKTMATFKVALIICAVALFLNMIGPIFIYFRMRVIRALMLDLRKSIFKHMQHLPLSYYEDNHSADSIFRLTSDVEAMKVYYTNHFMDLLYILFVPVFGVIAMYWFDPKIATFVLVLTIISNFVNIQFSKKFKFLSADVQKALSGLTQKLSDMLSGFKVLKIYPSDFVFHLFFQQNELTTTSIMKRTTRSATNTSINYFFYFIINVGTLIFGVILSTKGLVKISSLMAILSLQETVSGSIFHTSYVFSSLQTSLVSAQRIFDVLAIEKEPLKFGDAPFDAAKTSNTGISFQDVCFSYPSRDNILNQINVEVPFGKTIAFVGQSGSGKSTMVKLLMGFYQLTAGDIIINGNSINQYTLQTLRNLFSYVPQEPVLFEGTLKENIQFGKFDATEEEIIAATTAANAHDFITKLEHGYDSLVSARGENFSGGQRQRICIARAILKNAPFLLLDEATAALDSENEVLVQKGIQHLMKGKTCIVIAHRLKTIEHADYIYVFENGKIVEAGTHESLLALCAVYFNLVHKAV